MLKKPFESEIPEPCEIPLSVLIVEDSPQDAELEVATLGRAGYLVRHEVAPTEDVFRKMLSQGDFDIILADYNLQSWTGLDALHILNESGKDIPVVMVTGSLGDEAAVECIKEGAADYVLKDRLARLPLAVQRAREEAVLLRESRMAHEAVQQSAEKYRDLFENANDFIHSFAPDGRILYANRAWRNALGYSEGEIVELNVINTIHSEGRESWAEHIDRLLRGGTENKAEVVLVTKGGKKILGEASGTCKLVEGKPVFIRSIIRDITERRQLEEQIRKTAKMEAIRQLAGGVAHDFNNLLTIILGYGQILMESVNSKEKEYASEILKAGDRAASLTRQLLAFGPRQTIVSQAVNLNCVVANMEKMLRSVIGEYIELATAQQADLGWLKADPGQVEQALLNLVINARDALPEGGKITIETANVDLDKAYARTHVAVIPGPYVMLSVSDSGTGMDAETLTHIFEPFFTTKEPGKGTGLGLSSVYGIVKQSAGHVRVDSEVGRGSTFKVYFPRLFESVGNEGPATAELESVRGTETVLVVENETAIRSLVRATLQSNGYKVLESEGAEQALATAEAYREPIELLLTNVVIPQMSGIELAKQLAPFHPETAVLYMSGYTSHATVRHGVMDATTFFLQKPFAPGTLVKKVRKALDAKR